MNDADKKSFLAKLAAMAFNSSIVVPEGWKIEAFESKRSLSDFTPLITHHDDEMAKAVLAQFINLSKSSTGGLSSEQSDMFILGLMSIIRNIENLFNWYCIPQLIDFNFNSKTYPKLRARPFTDKQQQVLTDVFKNVMTAGANHCTPEFLVALEQDMAGVLDIRKHIDYSKVGPEHVQMVKETQQLQNESARAMKEAQAAGGKPNTANEKGQTGTKAHKAEGNA
jgi:hypothetical protein